MSSNTVWKLGVLLVVLGVAAHVLGWSSVMWFPHAVYDALAWLPRSLAETYHRSPVTVMVIGLGLLLMLIARIMMRRGR